MTHPELTESIEKLSASGRVLGNDRACLLRLKGKRSFTRKEKEFVSNLIRKIHATK